MVHVWKIHNLWEFLQFHVKFLYTKELSLNSLLLHQWSQVWVCDLYLLPTYIYCHNLIYSYWYSSSLFCFQIAIGTCKPPLCSWQVWQLFRKLLMKCIKLGIKNFCLMVKNVLIELWCAPNNQLCLDEEYNLHMNQVCKYWAWLIMIILYLEQ